MRRLTEALVWHHHVGVSLARLPLFAPVLDANGVVGFHHVGDLELGIHLRAGVRRRRRFDLCDKKLGFMHAQQQRASAGPCEASCPQVALAHNAVSRHTLFTNAKKMSLIDAGARIPERLRHICAINWDSDIRRLLG